ncbi:MAG: acylphosphatase, partial [Elusimicrobia bacterium]|nr:acylphosphatase [Elusimicrobiota bacterium]
MAENKRVKTIIKGSVQGIGYRWFVQDAAREMQIKGWVKNLYDGSVEIEAEGEKKKLEKFLKSLSKNPYAKISSIQSDWEEIVKEKYS